MAAAMAKAIKAAAAAETVVVELKTTMKFRLGSSLAEKKNFGAIETSLKHFESHCSAVAAHWYILRFLSNLSIILQARKFCPKFDCELLPKCISQNENRV